MIKAVNNISTPRFSADKNKSFQANSGFKNNFKEDIKRTMPLVMIMAGMWTIFDIRKSPKNFITPLINNVSVMAGASLIMSAVSSWFKIKPENNNK